MHKKKSYLLFCFVPFVIFFIITIPTKAQRVYLPIVTYKTANSNVFYDIFHKNNFNNSVILNGSNLFGVSDLFVGNINYQKRNDKNRFGLNLGFSGAGTYQNQYFQLAYERKMSNKIDFGLTSSLIRVESSVSNFEKNTEIGISPYLALNLIKNLKFKFYYDNISIGKNIFIEQVFLFGLQYQANTKVRLEGTYSSIDNFTFTLNYLASRSWIIHASLATTPYLFELGFSYFLKEPWMVSVLVNNHQILGFTPSLLFKLDF